VPQAFTQQEQVMLTKRTIIIIRRIRIFGAIIWLNMNIIQTFTVMCCHLSENNNVYLFELTVIIITNDTGVYSKLSHMFVNQSKCHHFS